MRPFVVSAWLLFSTVVVAQGFRVDERFGLPGLRHAPRCAAVFGGEIYVGGRFDNLETSPSYHLAKWTAAGWADAGMNIFSWNLATAVVNDMLVFDDGGGTKLFLAGRFKTIAGGASYLLATYDGVVWRLKQQANDASGTFDEARALAVYDAGQGPSLYCGGRFTTNGNYGSIHTIGRWNGQELTPVGVGIALTSWAGTVQVNAMTAYSTPAGSHLYVGGSFTNATGANAKGMARWNGTSWSGLSGGVVAQVGAPAPGVVHSLVVHDTGTGPRLWVGGKFAQAGGTVVNNLAYWTDVGWSAIGGVGTTSDEVRAVASFGGELLVGTSATTIGATTVNGFGRYAGGTWTTAAITTNPLPTFPIVAFRTIDFGAGPEIMILRDTTTTSSTAAAVAGGNVFRFDGSTVTELVGPAAGLGLSTNDATAPFGYVTDMASFDDGQSEALYAVGRFDHAGPTAAFGVARWNGIAWTALAAALPAGASAQSIAVFDDGAGAALYVGGSFNFPSFGHTGLVRFAGGVWTPIAGLADSLSIDALTVYDDGAGEKLYLAGKFANGASPIGRIRTFDGAVVAPFGAGEFSNTGVYPATTGAPEVRAMTVFDDGMTRRLVIGGRFSSIGGVSCESIAAWDGSAITALGHGFRRDFGSDYQIGTPRIGEVNTLTTYSNGFVHELIAGGRFSSAENGQVLCGCVARWDGAHWSALGSPLQWSTNPDERSVNALGVFHEGYRATLWIGGRFDSLANGTHPNQRGLIMWDGAVYTAPFAGAWPWTWITSSNPIDEPPISVIREWRDQDGPALYFGGRFKALGDAGAVGFARYFENRPIVTPHQAGPGAPLYVDLSNLTAGHEYWTLFSVEPAPHGPGSGPYLGLWTADVQFLLAQVFVNPETPPFRMVAPGATLSMGPFAVFPGITFETATFDFTGFVLGPASGVVRYTEL